MPEHIWKNAEEAARLVQNPPQALVPSGFQLSVKPDDHPEGKSGLLGRKPGIKTLVFQRFDNPTAMKLALANGSISFAEGLTPALWRSLKTAPAPKLALPGRNFKLPSTRRCHRFRQSRSATQPSSRTSTSGRRSYALNTSVLVRRCCSTQGSSASIRRDLRAVPTTTPPKSATYHHDQQRAEQILNADGWKMAERNQSKERQAALAAAVRAEPVADPDAGRPVHQGLAERDRHQGHADGNVG